PLFAFSGTGSLAGGRDLPRPTAIAPCRLAQGPLAPGERTLHAGGNERRGARSFRPRRPGTGRSSPCLRRRPLPARRPASPGARVPAVRVPPPADRNGRATGGAVARTTAPGAGPSQPPL